MANRLADGFIFKAIVRAIFQDTRLVHVEWLVGGKTAYNVKVVTNPGVFSFPEIGDIGLVIGDEVNYYYLGKLDAFYPNKIKGTVKNASGDKLLAKNIDGGEAAVANLAKNIWLTLSNSENFSLMNGLQEGLQYVKAAGMVPLRLLKLMGQTVQLLASGQSVSIGAVIRSIPVLGPSIIVDPTTKQGAVEFLSAIKNVTGIITEKLHLGNIFTEPIANPNVPIPTLHTEIGATGVIPAAMLRALFGVFNDLGLEIAAVKVDKLGNMSITAKLPGTGKLIIKGDTGTHIGGTIEETTAHPAVLGDQLSTWLTSHVHDSPIGPTGPPNAASLATLPTILSLKVFFA